MSESKPGPIRRFLVGLWNTVNFTRRLVFNLVFVVLLFATSLRMLLAVLLPLSGRFAAIGREFKAAIQLAQPATSVAVASAPGGTVST